MLMGGLGAAESRCCRRLGPMQNNPTGAQFPIAHGRYGAVVTEVGATLRSLTLDGQEVL